MYHYCCVVERTLSGKSCYYIIIYEVLFYILAKENCILNEWMNQNKEETKIKYFNVIYAFDKRIKQQKQRNSSSSQIIMVQT